MLIQYKNWIEDHKRQIMEQSAYGQEWYIKELQRAKQEDMKALSKF